MLVTEPLPEARATRPTDRQWRHLAIEENLHVALAQERLLFAFQPVVCAASGEIDYFECLLRLRDDGGLVPCGEFIAAAEETGLIGLIDRYVLNLAFSEVAAHSSVRLGFNVSARTASDRPWLRSLIAMLRGRSQCASRLVVEITETAVLDDIAELAHFVDALRCTGCRVALDDFGAGHTSLRHLQTLDVDIIKIDGSFVHTLQAHRENRIILRHLLELTRGFGFHTVAECVETAEQAALLREAGVGYLQGFYLGRPTIERPWLPGQDLTADGGR